MDDYDLYRDVRNLRQVDKYLNEDVCEVLKQKPFTKIVSRCDLSQFDISRNIPRVPGWIFSQEYNVDGLGVDEWINEKTTVLWEKRRPLFETIEKVHGIKPIEVHVTQCTSYGISYIHLYSEVNVESFYA